MKDDLISRQVALSALNGRKTAEKSALGNARNTVVDWCVDAIKALPPAQPEIIHCKDCRWGREVSGNIECFVDSNIPPEYHGYEWFCPNGERRTDDSW